MTSCLLRRDAAQLKKRRHNYALGIDLTNLRIPTVGWKKYSSRPYSQMQIVATWPISMFGSHRRDRPAITRRALSCNIAWSSATLFGWLRERVHVIDDNLGNPGRPAEIDMASRR